MTLPKILKYLAVHVRLMIVIGAIPFMLAGTSWAGLVGPYAVDTNTLHLWHFEETGATPANAPTNALAFDAVTSNTNTSPIVLSNTPGPVSVSGWPGYPPNNFALQAQPSFSYPGVANYGLCVMTTNFSCLLPPWSNPNPTLNNTATYLTTTNMSDFINTNTGAFTFEALVCPLVNPLTAGRNMEIISGDDGFPFRAWQFRINASGQLEANIGINDSGTPAPVHDVFRTLPSSGPDAVIAGNWYHVAVTYTGDAPNNGDTAKQLRLYWTLMDPTRTNADVLLLTNLTYGFTNIAVPVVAIGGSARGSPINNVGNSEGFVGFIDEARISSVCRKSTEMAFNTNVFNASPILTGPQTNSLPFAATNVLVGYGQTLTLVVSAVGSLPITNQWYKDGVLLAAQTNATLVISNVTFAASGNYSMTSTNAFGGTNSVTANVVVGAGFQGVFNTGVDANGNSLYPTLPGSVDLHYLLVQSADSTTVNSNAIVWGGNPNGGSANSSISGWIGPRNGGAPPVGTYSYQTQFQMDNGDVGSAVLAGRMWAGGPSANPVQAFLNGVETDITLAPNNVSTAAPFTITNGLLPGYNTLVFTLNDSSGNFPGALRVEMSGLGNALPPGLPNFTNQPASQTVSYGANVILPALALGRPPLSYQWYSNGVAITPAANSTATTSALALVGTNFNPSQVVGGQFAANYQLVVSNDSGSVTSSVATLIIQLPPLALTAAGTPIWKAANNQTNIAVTFSDTLDPVSAVNIGNYSLDNGASVLSAIETAPNEVLLTTTLLNPVTAYTLTVQNVKDFFGDTVTTSPTNLLVGVYPVNLALWVRASAGVTTNSDGTVAQWNDLSANANNLLGGTFEPVLAADPFTGLPVVRFDGSIGTFMTAAGTTSLAIANDMTIFTVINYATLAGGTNGMVVSKVNNNNQPAPYDYYAQSGGVKLLRGNGSGNAAVTSTNAPSTGVQHLMDVVMQGTTVTHRLDGRSSGVGTLSTAIADTGQPLSIGIREDGVNRFTGDMAELILIGSALSSNDVASMEGYLATAYSLPIGANSRPAITLQPVASTNVSQGSSLTIAAAASGNPAVTYQWYDTNNIAIAGQTNAVLAINNVQTSDSYYLQVTNVFGSVNSSTGAVNVISGLNVSLGPPGLTVYAGHAVTLSAVALGTVPIYYQWSTNGVGASGATSSTYTIVVPPGSTTVTCTVSNAYNGFTSTNAGPVSLTGVAAPTNLYQAAILGNNPVAFWRLNEVPDNGSGNGGVTAYDYVGGHNAIYTNAILGLPAFSSLSSTDTAAEFGVFGFVTPGNGTVTNNQNSYAGELNQSASGLSQIDFATPSGRNAELSVEAWVSVFENVKTNVTQVAGAGIVTKGYGNGGEQFALDINGGFRFFVRDASGGVHSSVSGTVPATNGWYHLVGVWDGANGVAHLYTNGVDVGASPAASAGIGLLTATTTNAAFPQAAQVSIGSRTSSQSVTNYDQQFKGKISNVAIYNYAMSHTTVQADYVAGLKNAIFSANPTNIVSTLTGANLTLFWPVDHFGWQLQAQTNILTVGISTNWVNVTGSILTNQVVVPIIRTNGSVFYRLIYVP